VRVRSEGREERLDARRAKSEERASWRSWRRSVERSAPERGLVREPLWGRG
jgi:transposase-like protein